MHGTAHVANGAESAGRVKAELQAGTELQAGSELSCGPGKGEAGAGRTAARRGDVRCGGKRWG